MKPASPALIALLAGNTDFLMADLWTFQLRNGVTLRYTNWDMPLTLGGHTYAAADVLCDGGKLTATVGLEAGDDEVTCYPNTGAGTTAPVSMAGSTPFLAAVPQGLFNRAVVTKIRVFMPTPGDTTPGGITIFVGEIVEANSQRYSVTFKMKDMRNLLNLYMPRRQYQPTCPWVFGDANCGFDVAGQTQTSSVSMTPANGYTVNCGLTQAAGFFNNGTLTFTSGINAGSSRSVKGWTPGVATLVAPFPVPSAIGDTFTLAPGCTKYFAGPTGQFAAASQPGSTPNQIVTTLSNSAGYFTGGTIQGTSGANVGVTVGIASWSNGIAVLSSPFPNQPNVGGGLTPQDEYELTAVSSNSTGSCTGWWGADANLHFGGQRFVPVPETSY